MDEYQKLTEVAILNTFQSLKEELIEGLSKVPESGQNEAVYSNTSEHISTDNTEIVCEREVYFTTPQQNRIKKFNSMSDFPNASSSLKAEDTNYHKASVHKYGIREVDDIFKNELDKVDPLILPDTKPASIINVNMVEQLVVCKSETKEGENTFNLEKIKFELEEKKVSFMKREYLKEEEDVKSHDDENPTIKTEEKNEMNLTDMDLNYPAITEDTNPSERISTGSTELVCEREVYFTTSQQNHIEKFNSMSDFPNDSSSLKAEDANYHKSSMQCEVDNIFKNELDKVDPLILPDTKPYSIRNVNMVEQSVVCKSETKEGENTFNLEKIKFELEEKKMLFMKREYLKEEEDVKSHDEENPTIKTKERNEMNLTDMDLNYPGITEDTNPRAEGINLILPDLTRNCEDLSEIICADGIVGGDLQTQHGIGNMSMCYNEKLLSKSVASIKHKYKNIINRKEKYNIKLSVKERIYPFNCAHCGKSFTKKVHLKYHMKTHDELIFIQFNQFKKNVIQQKKEELSCGGNYPREKPQRKNTSIKREACKKHFRIQERIRLYGCSQCNEKFMQGRNLKTNLRNHEEIRPYNCLKCNKTFAYGKNLKRNLRIHEGLRPYKCSQCNKRFMENDNLKSHLRIHEGTHPYECPHCNKNFMQSSTLKNHLLRVHKGPRPYECHQCNKRFTASNSLKKHMRKHEGVHPFECPQCNKRFTASKILKGHLRIHEGIYPYECSQCNKKFIKRGNLKSHLRSHEGLRPYECSQCNKKFTASNSLKRHLRTHEGIRPRPYECPQCNKRFMENGILKRHLRIHKGIHPYECPQCKKRFIESAYLKNHLRKHEGVRPYECPQCKKRFMQSSILKYHLRTHEGIRPRPYACPQCNKRFMENGNLKRHLRTHEGVRPFECTQCNKRFTESWRLKRHLRTHEGIRRYECPECNERFTGSGRLKIHLRTHEGIRPYECPQCNKRFMASAILKRHLRTHEGVRPYECPQCNKRFTESWRLKIHLRTHEGIRPYQCPQCNKRFTASGNLKRHLRTHEGI